MLYIWKWLTHLIIIFKKDLYVKGFDSCVTDHSVFDPACGGGDCGLTGIDNPGLWTSAAPLSFVRRSCQKAFMPFKSRLRLSIKHQCAAENGLRLRKACEFGFHAWKGSTLAIIKLKKRLIWIKSLLFVSSPRVFLCPIQCSSWLALLSLNPKRFFSECLLWS